jgi:hypothetical protein
MWSTIKLIWSGDFILQVRPSLEPQISFLLVILTASTALVKLGRPATGIRNRRISFQP